MNECQILRCLFSHCILIHKKYIKDVTIHYKIKKYISLFYYALHKCCCFFLRGWEIFFLTGNERKNIVKKKSINCVPINEMQH